MKVIIYLIGVIPGYLSYRYYMTRDGMTWAASDRALGILLSFISWFCVLASFVGLFILSLNDKKPVKW